MLTVFDRDCIFGQNFAAGQLKILPKNTKKETTISIFSKQVEHVYGCFFPLKIKQGHKKCKFFCAGFRG